MRDQQVASFVGSIAVLTKNQGGNKENVLRGMGPAPTQKGQWGVRSSTQDPHPWIGSPMGNQASIVPRLL